MISSCWFALSLSLQNAAISKEKSFVFKNLKLVSQLCRFEFEACSRAWHQLHDFYWFLVLFLFVIGQVDQLSEVTWWALLWFLFFRYGSPAQSGNASGSHYQPYNKPKNKQYKDRRGSPRGQHQDTGKKHGRKTPESERTTGEQWRTVDFNGHAF